MQRAYAPPYGKDPASPDQTTRYVEELSEQKYIEL
jgi:hypothetical protein